MIRQWKSFPKPKGIEMKIALWAGNSEFGFCFNGSGWGSHFDFQYSAFAGVGVHAQFQNEILDAPAFVEQQNDFIVSHICYDVKNELEALKSENPDHVQFPNYGLTVPEVVVLVDDNSVNIGWNAADSAATGEQYFSEITTCQSHDRPIESSVPVRMRIERNEYLKQIEVIQRHIQVGDIYQANYCQEVYWQGIDLHPAQVYFQGYVQNPNPFSVFYKLGHHSCMSWSPERYLSFDGSQVVSQPMKGTAKRGSNDTEDKLQLDALKSSEKDRRENVMIVDMVRNDLSKTADLNSVTVPELYVIETYPKVHKMYSTVKSKIKPGMNLMDTILASFPMGSMTGAPKIRAMQIIEDAEHSRRGLFSGTVGFITPEKNADFNVIIRSMIYNGHTRYLSAHVGGGITALSDPIQEYEECETKLKPMLDLMDQLLSD